jgi:hypothetical protein
MHLTKERNAPSHLVNLMKVLHSKAIARSAHHSVELVKINEVVKDQIVILWLKLSLKAIKNVKKEELNVPGISVLSKS